MLAAIGAAMIAASCGGAVFSGSESQHATLGSLAFDVPLDWRRTDTSMAGAAATSVWTPDPTKNDRKESVTVIRSELLPRGKPTAAMLDRLLAGAQGSLRAAKVTPVTPITTDQGLTGARIDVSFQPGVSTQRYRRIHVVLVDVEASALVHVLYTAANPDEGLDAFYLVLDSIRRQES